MKFPRQITYGFDRHNNVKSNIVFAGDSLFDLATWIIQGYLAHIGYRGEQTRCDGVKIFLLSQQMAAQFRVEFLSQDSGTITYNEIAVFVSEHRHDWKE